MRCFPIATAGITSQIGGEVSQLRSGGLVQGKQFTPTLSTSTRAPSHPTTDLEPAMSMTNVSTEQDESSSEQPVALHSYYAADRDGNGTWKMRSKPAAQRRAARLSFKSGTARMAVSSQLSSQSFISLIRFLRACSALSDAAQRAPPSIHHDGGSAEFCTHHRPLISSLVLGMSACARGARRAG